MIFSRLRSAANNLAKSMATATPASHPGPLENAIRSKLTAQFAPTELKISNDSWQHRHHAAMRAQGSDGTGETHFSIFIVSSACFKSKTTMQRHRLIYAALKEELDGGLHSLSLQTKTEEELVLAESRNGQSS